LKIKSIQPLKFYAAGTACIKQCVLIPDIILIWRLHGFCSETYIWQSDITVYCWYYLVKPLFTFWGRNVVAPQRKLPEASVHIFMMANAVIPYHKPCAWHLQL